MVNNILNTLLKLATIKRAEKIIIQHQANSLNFIIQIPLTEDLIFKLPLDKGKTLSRTFKKLLKIAPDELINNQYFKLQGKDFDLSFYLDIVITKEGEKIIINLKSSQQAPLTLNQLGLDLKSRKKLINILEKKTGLVVFASPPQQGLSTSLQALLFELDKNSDRNIYYFSDNEEKSKQFNNIIVASNKNIFWSELRAQTADIVVTDLLTKKTDIKQAIDLANTRRLIIVSLQASNALETLYKLLTISPQLSLILDNLQVIVAQKLVNLKRTNHPQYLRCNKDSRQQIAIFEHFSLTNNIKKFIRENHANIKTKKFWHQLLNLSLKKAYIPFIIDEDKKLKDEII